MIVDEEGSWESTLNESCEGVKDKQVSFNTQKQHAEAFQLLYIQNLVRRLIRRMLIELCACKKCLFNV